MSQSMNKIIINMKIHLENQYFYGARESGSTIVDNGIQRRRIKKQNSYENEIAFFGSSFRGLLKELAYDICKSGVFPFTDKDAFSPHDPNQADPGHPFYSMFGFVDAHGKLRVSVGEICDENSDLSTILENRTSIRVDQSIRSAIDGGLFTYEIANVKVVSYSIELTNGNENEKALLLAILNSLEGRNYAGRGSTGAGIILKAEFDKTGLANSLKILEKNIESKKSGGK